jgi:hypothetical protein
MTLVYPYDNSVINLLFYKKMNPSYTLIELIKTLREPPIEWFTECSNCEFENVEGWDLCQNCRKTFEESLDD